MEGIESYEKGLKLKLVYREPVKLCVNWCWVRRREAAFCTC